MNAPSSSSSATGQGFPAPRVQPSVAHAFGGIWRLTVRRFYSPTRWLVLAAMLGLLTLFSVPASHGGDYREWAALFYVCFLVPVMAFLSAAGAMRDDLQAGAVDYLFTRPVRRPTYVFLRYLAHMACAQIDFLFSLAVVLVVGAQRPVPGLWDVAPVLLAGQVMIVMVFSAFGFLCAMLTSRYVIVGLVYGVLIEVGIGNVPTQLSRLSMIRQARGILSPALGDTRVGMGGPFAVETLSAPAATFLLLCTTLVLLGAAAAIFHRRELAGTGSREA
jgi:ABC-type transport system involved in multi-copper enzyme maturation permease subunit